jgi:hypothetical protein
MKAPRFVSAPKIDTGTDKELIERSKEFYAMMQKRRTVRIFRPVQCRVN